MTSTKDLTINVKHTGQASHCIKTASYNNYYILCFIICKASYSEASCQSAVCILLNQSYEMHYASTGYVTKVLRKISYRNTC